MKYLIWTLIIVGMALLTRVLTHHNARKAMQARNTSNKKSGTDTPEPMVRCAHCQIYLPRSEAILSNGKTWCSSEHASIGRN